MGTLLARLVLAGVPKGLAKLITYVGVPLLIGGLIYFAVTTYGDARYNAGVSDEKAAEQDRQRQAQEAQRKLEREATANLEQSRREDAAAAANRKTEIDDATRNLPDQAPSARQRSRACLEIRRQGGTC
jgi:hypothetical protein